MMDEGTGPPVIVIPGIEGRWEWMRPALRALVPTCRTISYSLAGDSGAPCQPAQAVGFEKYVQQLDAVFDRLGLQTAALCCWFRLPCPAGCRRPGSSGTLPGPA